MTEVEVELDPNEILEMYHPDIKQTGVTSRAAFEGVWSTRGWKLTADSAVELMGPVLDDPDAHSDDELRIVLNTVGGTFAVAGNETREDLVGRVAVLRQHAESPETSAVGARLAGLEPPQSGVDTYNPDDHTVQQVNDWLTNADPSEAIRVLAAEAAGKNRIGIVEGPYAHPTERSPSVDNYDDEEG